MQLDECLRCRAARDEIERAMQLSLRWAERCKTRVRGVRGGPGPVRHRAGRRLSGACAQLGARALVEIGFDGYAIGGLAVGEPQDVDVRHRSDATAPLLPADRPRYLMGVGKPDDIVEAVARGIDMFDCVLPTRSGRHGKAFTRFGADQSAQCAPRRRSAPARRRERAVRPPRLFARLSASLDQGERDPRGGAADRPSISPTTRS